MRTHAEEEAALLLQTIAETARQLALLTVLAGPLTAGAPADLRRDFYGTLATAQQLTLMQDALAPAVIARTA